MTPHKPATSTLQPSNPWLAGVLLVILGILAYSSVFHAQFIWDDDILITDNALVQSSGGLYRIWFSTQPVDYFPLTSTVFWIEWRLFGDSPCGYHIVNLALHLVGSLLLWAVFVRLTIPGAWLAATLFAVHPVAVSSVAWVSEHKNTLSLCFYLLAILAYLAFTDRRIYDLRHRNYTLALVAFFLALLAKSSVAVLPVILLLIIWWKRRRVTASDILALVPFFALSVIMGLITVWFQFNRAMKDMDMPPMEPLLARIAGTGWNVWFYLCKAFVPLNLTMIYPKWEINPADLSAWLPLVSLLVLFAILVCLAAHYRLEWSRAALFVLAVFVITLCPVLGLIDMAFRVHSPVADHFQYFALPAMTALFSATVTTLVRRYPSIKLPLFFLASAFVLIFASLTWYRVQIFQNVETISRQNIAVNPDSALAWHNLGYAFAHQASPNLQAAANAYNQELKNFPASVQGALGLADVLSQNGQFSEAMSQLDKTIALKPNTASLLNSRGNVRLRLNDPDGAIADFQSSIQADPGKPEPHNNLGNVLASKSQLTAAILHFRRAIELDPEFASAHLNLANALFRTGDLKGATTEYQMALQLNPQSVAGHFNFAVFLFEQGLYQAACRQARAALTIDPECAPARRTLERAQALSDSSSVRQKQ